MFTPAGLVLFPISDVTLLGPLGNQPNRTKLLSGLKLDLSLARITLVMALNPLRNMIQRKIKLANGSVTIEKQIGG